MNRISLIFIDQVRSNIKNNMSYASGKSVGDFSDDFKAATSTHAFVHNVKQWIFYDRKRSLNRSEPLGVDGWVLSAKTEKNKLAPSQVEIAMVFDKKYGIIPLFSEYLFLSEMMPSEKRYTKSDSKKLVYPLAVETVKKSKVINVIDPDTGEILESSEKFMERNLWDKYYGDPEFKRIFDRAMDLSVKYRIGNGLLRTDINAEANEGDVETNEEAANKEMGTETEEESSQEEENPSIDELSKEEPPEM